MIDEFIFQNERFRPTKLESEDHLEKLILENRDTIFPHAYIFDYKKQAKTRTTGQITTADMCLVSHDCSKWWIIEVERSKGSYYAFNTIQPQIAIQADADWNKTSHHAVEKLIQFGVSKEKASNIKSIEPGFILIYDEIDVYIESVADEHFFKKIILKPYMSEMGKYALVPIIQQVSPEPPEENTYRVDSKLKIAANKLWIPLSASMKNRISNKKLSFLIDGNTFPVSIQMNNNITIPISNEKESQTSRLVYNHLNCLFDIEEDSDSIQFVFREERKWKND